MKNHYGLFKKDDIAAGFIQTGTTPDPVTFESRLPAEIGVVFGDEPISDVEHRPQAGKVVKRSAVQIAARRKQIKDAETVPADQQAIPAKKILELMLEKGLISEADIAKLREAPGT